MTQPLERLGELALVPVIEIQHAEHAVRLGEALAAGGLPCVEITFRTAAAEESIRRIASALPQVVIGAGTVLAVDQAQQAVLAGAQFIVSPGFNPRVVDWCLEHEVPVTPGVATPTEIDMALDKGLHILKFFPAEALGGVAMLKAIAAPYGGVKFIPTGGINLQNLADYLKLPMVYACGGSWLAPAKLISAGAFDEITRLTREAVVLVRQCRGAGGSQ
jgi:2-dehydro-3-deoxyphosphogluconate aldolase/(4S)-4-hydroxy-2-oxoglutarate aldolase